MEQPSVTNVFGGISVRRAVQESLAAASKVLAAPKSLR
jgi:hypothetical protein